jgi:cytochrome c biogenesis factor
MAYEIFFLIAAALMLLVDLTLLSISKFKDKRKKTVGLVTTITTFSLIMISYALLLQAFTINDFQVIGVYSYSSSSLSLLSKVYASWAGAGGSMLFLTILLSAVYLSLRLIAFKKPDRFHISACQVFSFILLIFIIVCLIRNPFERFADVPIEGKGLNPQLQTLWMVIHPPIVFSAYAFVLLAYALTLASIKTNRELDSSTLFKFSTSIAWLFLTLGIALGGVWAYEVLGWGGYWAWDPVETASLLPWLLLTAYFIVKAIPTSKPTLTKEFMIMITFGSLVFLSALTRGGFTTSVHSYAASAMGPVLLTFALVMIGYFFYLKSKMRIPLFKIDVNKSSLISRCCSVGFWSLIAIAVVCLVGLAFPNFSYSYATFPFVLIFTISLLGFGFGEKTHYLRLLLIVAVAIGVGVVASFIGLPNVNILTTLAFPLLLTTFLILLYGVINAFRLKSMTLFSRAFLALSIIVLLFGVFMSAGVKTTTTIDNVKVNTLTSALQYNIQLSDLTSNQSLTQVYSEKTGKIVPEYATLSAHVIVQHDSEVYDGTLIASVYSNYGVMLRPLIISTASGDIYLHFEYTDTFYNALVSTYSGSPMVPDALSVTLQNNPMIYLVWTGVALMCCGIAIQFADKLKATKPQ